MDQDAAQVRWLVVDSEQTGQRLDNWLTSRLKGAPRSLIYRIIRSGEVRVNRGRAQAATRLATGDVIRMPPLQLAAASPAPVIGEALARSLPPRILYREGGLILLDKPAGLAVHGGSGLQYGVIEALRQALDRPDLELIHRLDRETSGLLMIAEKRSTLRLLQEYLREGHGEAQHHGSARRARISGITMRRLQSVGPVPGAGGVVVRLLHQSARCRRAGTVHLFPPDEARTA